MTTLGPPPSWYADPSGRHEARYWDGFTWTAHIADRGEPGIDPLVSARPVGGASGPTAPEPEAVGPGTAALRAMADTRVKPAPAMDIRAALARGRRGRSVTFELTAALAMALVLVLGGSVLWTSWRSSGSGGRTDRQGFVPFHGTGYRVEVPPSWVNADLPAGSAADAAFTVIDGVPVKALVGPEPGVTAGTTDRVALEQRLVDELTASFSGEGASVTVTDRGVTQAGARLTAHATVDVVTGDGANLRSLEYVVVEHTGSVAIGLVGSPDAVDRHAADVARVARTARLR